MMVVGEESPGSATQQRRRSSDLRPIDDGDSGRRYGRFIEPPTRISLARNAFPGLVNTAASFQRRITLIVWGLVIMLFLTCGLSWYVTAGNAILTHLDAVHSQEHDLMKKIALIAPPLSPDVPVVADHLLERLCQQMASATQKEKMVDGLQLCEEYNVKIREHTAMGATLDRWLTDAFKDHENQPKHRSGMLIFGAQVAAGAVPGPALPANPRTAAEKEHDEHASDEEFSRILTQVLVGAVLPFLYGILGAGAAVLRDLWQKMRLSLLAPRDYTLAIGNLCLGAVIGACIGLFMPTGGTAPGDNALGGFILTASAMSFIAGFGVEGVFLALESVVRRLFNTEHRRNPSP